MDTRTWFSEAHRDKDAQSRSHFTGRLTRGERQAQFLERLIHLTTASFALEETVAQAYELLAEICPADQMSLVVMSPFEEPFAHVFPKRDAVANPAELDYLFKIARAVAQAQTLVHLQVADAKDSASTALDLKSLPAKAQSIIAVPLLSQVGVQAVLIVESHRPDELLTASDQEIVTALAQQLSLVVERERAVDEARRRTDQLAAFSAVASTVNEWVEVEQLARRFLSVFLNTTNTTFGLFYLLEQQQIIRLVAHFGLANELLESFRVTRLTYHPDVQMALEQGRLLLIEDIQHAAISERARALAETIPARAAVFLPLRVKGRGIGLVILARPEGKIEIADREFAQGLADQAAQAIENARLFAESQRRFQEQSALRDLAQRFLSAVSPDEVLERTLDALATLLPADYYEVLLPDGDGLFSLVNGRGWRRGVVGRTRTVDDPHLHAGYVLRAQLPVIVENFTNEARFQPSDYLMRHQVLAGVCAPMLAETRTIGLLGVYSRAPRQFSEEQSHFLYLVATQTAMALEKARHSQQAARRLDELILLNDVIVAANSEVSLELVLRSITAEVGVLLDSQDVQVYFMQDKDVELRAALRPTAHETDFDWGKAIANWVIRNRQPQLIQDLARDARFNANTVHARACLGAPMTIGERVIGVIAVAHPEPNAFDANDQRLLTTLGGQIAAAIERARLLDETGKRLAEISAMFEFSNKLRTATNEMRMLEIIVQDAVRVLEGSGGSLQLLSPDGANLIVSAVHHMKHLGSILPRSEGGLSWQAHASGESFAVEDVMQDARVRSPQMFEQIHGAIVAPLSTPSGVLGTLLVGFAERIAPSAAKVRLATTIANLSAQALQRSRLHEQTLDQAASLAAALGDLEESYQATLLALSAALDARDRETEGHSQRVTKWALAVGRQLDLSPEELTNLERGSLLHDVGKIGISDNILLKAGPLTPQERKLMDQHPKLGYNMLKDIPFLHDALPVVLHHQEMWDGSGYPSGLRGEEIPLAARIFAIADTYDAMTSTRPYRRALTHAAALEEIERCRGTQFDPRVVDAFLELFRAENRVQ